MIGIAADRELNCRLVKKAYACTESKRTHLAPFAGKGSEVKARRWFAAHSAQLIHLKHAIVIIVISFYMHQERPRNTCEQALIQF